MRNTILHLLYPLLSGLLFSGILSPLLIKFAHKHKIYDDTDHRKIHEGDISRLGGVGIFLSFVSGIIIFRNYYIMNTVFLSMAGAAFLLGFIDDLHTTKARYKLMAQILIGVVCSLSGLLYFDILLPLTQNTVHMGLLAAWGLSVFWMIGATNALNLVDGIDGLAGGISTLIVLFMGITALIHNHVSSAVLCFLMAGSISGFLLFNFPPARIFMGDGGSYLLGFFISMLPVLGLSDNKGQDLIIVITLMLIPVLDTFSAIIRRKRGKKQFFVPDREHIHHKLLALGFSGKQIIFMFYGITIMLGTSALLFSISSGFISWIQLFSTWLLTLVFFLYVSDRYHKTE